MKCYYCNNRVPILSTYCNTCKEYLCHPIQTVAGIIAFLFLLYLWFSM